MVLAEGELIDCLTHHCYVVGELGDTLWHVVVIVLPETKNSISNTLRASTNACRLANSEIDGDVDEAPSKRVSLPQEERIFLHLLMNESRGVILLCRAPLEDMVIKAVIRIYRAARVERLHRDDFTLAMLDLCCIGSIKSRTANSESMIG